MQKSIDDYEALLNFLAVPSLGDKATFDFWIAEALRQEKLGSSGILKTLVRATCIRRTKRMLQNVCELPRKTELVEKVELDGTDR